MNVWVVLIGGIILGWLVEWLIDWYYWRRGAEAFYTMERDLRNELASTRQELAEAQAALARLHGQPAPETGMGRTTGPRDAATSAARDEQRPR
ncbi:MAG: hypothetical protein IT329_16515 [Caldilineaceae bacterium]|nr:hypothetical protein [Caldilineaceae bacterium]